MDGLGLIVKKKRKALLQVRLIDGYIPLGVPTGYSVSFAQDGSAEIVYTPPVKPEIVMEEPIPE